MTKFDVSDVKQMTKFKYLKLNLFNSG